MQPKQVSDVDLAFPTTIEGFLPPKKDIPSEFQNNSNPYVDKIQQWFFSGVKTSDFIAKEGVDKDAALRHICYCMSSFEPSHGHKVAGCAYLLSEWFILA